MKMNVDSNMEEQNPITQQFILGASQQKNGEDEERIDSNEPRAEAEPTHELVTKPTPKKEEHMQVEDFIGEPKSNSC
jgi:hypothetical protein